MSPYVLAALFFTLFALVLGVPRAMNRRRIAKAPHPEDGTFDRLLDELAALDPSRG